jgi:hypothetical protein
MLRLILPSNLDLWSLQDIVVHIAKAFKDYQRLISHCIHNTDFGIGVVLLWCAGLLDWIETNRRSHSSSSNNVEDNHKAQIMYSIRRYSTFINM